MVEYFDKCEGDLFGGGGQGMQGGLQVDLSD